MDLSLLQNDDPLVEEEFDLLDYLRNPTKDYSCNVGIDSESLYDSPPMYDDDIHAWFYSSDPFPNENVSEEDYIHAKSVVSSLSSPMSIDKLDFDVESDLDDSYVDDIALVDTFLAKLFACEVSYDGQRAYVSNGDFTIEFELRDTFFYYLFAYDDCHCGVILADLSCTNEFCSGGMLSSCWKCVGDPLNLRTNSLQDGENDASPLASRPFTRSQARELQHLQSLFMKREALEYTFDEHLGSQVHLLMKISWGEEEEMGSYHNG